MLTPSTIDASKQARSDSKNAYLDPSDGRPNLTVLTKHQGISLIFNGTKDDYGKLLVGGVKFQADPSSPVYEAYSIKEVIVSYVSSRTSLNVVLEPSTRPNSSSCPVSAQTMSSKLLVSKHSSTCLSVTISTTTCRTPCSGTLCECQTKPD